MGRNSRIESPDQNAGRVHLPIVATDREIPVCHQPCEDPRDETLSRTRLAPIGGAEGICESQYVLEMVSARAYAHDFGRPWNCISMFLLISFEMGEN